MGGWPLKCRLSWSSVSLIVADSYILKLDLFSGNQVRALFKINFLPNSAFLLLEFMNSSNLQLKEFVCFCVKRRGKVWPALYDEMALVASQRLFKGLGFAELKQLGFSLSISNLDNLIRFVEQITCKVDMNQQNWMCFIDQPPNSYATFLCLTPAIYHKLNRLPNARIRVPKYLYAQIYENEKV